MMLIQIQFIKRDLMAAMKAMDEILRENRFNLQVGRKDKYPALCRTFAVDRHHRRAYVYGACDAFTVAGGGSAGMPGKCSRCGHLSLLSRSLFVPCFPFLPPCRY
jgi:hypothetical protein